MLKKFQGKQAGNISGVPGSSAGKRYIKKASTATVAGSNVTSAFIPIYAKEVRKQGQLYHQVCFLSESLFVRNMLIYTKKVCLFT